MISDRDARAILVAVWPGRTLAEYQIVQAIGRFEGNYGAAFDAANNWGASQRPALADGSCPLGTTATPDFDAQGVQYTACIFRLPSPEAGARALVRALTAPRRPEVGRALTSGNARRVAGAMSRSGYMAAKPDRYALSIQRNARTIARALGEPLKVTSSSPASSSPLGAFAFVAVFLEFAIIAFLATRGRT